MEKKDRNKWANKFRELGKKKGSRSDYVKLYKEMKKEKEENQKSVDPKNPKNSRTKVSGVFYSLFLIQRF